MPCQATVVDSQAEYEFFVQTLANPALNSCCGPLVALSFQDPARSQLLSALAEFDLDASYLDIFDLILLESGELMITMCTKHWIKHSQAIATVAFSHNHEQWAELAYYIYRLLCKANGWDYKEISNYIRNNSTQEKE